MTPTAETLRQMRLRGPLLILYLTLAQLGIGTGIVRIIYAQRPPLTIDGQVELLSARQIDVASRITSLEQQNLPTRIALIEQAQVDQRESSKEMRQLLYGVLIALAGSLFAQILQLRRSPRKDD